MQPGQQASSEEGLILWAATCPAEKGAFQRRAGGSETDGGEGASPLEV